MSSPDRALGLDLPEIEGAIRLARIRSAEGRVDRIRWLVKRTVDLIAACALLALLVPLMLLLMAFILAVDRHRPLYLDTRVGRSGKGFKCAKLRTMRDAPHLLIWHLEQNPAEKERYQQERKLLDDPRRTRLGTLIRRFSIDEMPQLVNVLLGQMSIVGPRPITLGELQERGAAARDLLLMRPGITGLWQVSGRSNLPLGARNELDSQYVRNWSIRSDLIIMLRTPLVMLTGRGAV